MANDEATRPFCIAAHKMQFHRGVAISFLIRALRVTRCIRCIHLNLFVMHSCTSRCVAVAHCRHTSTDIESNAFRNEVRAP